MTRWPISTAVGALEHLTKPPPLTGMMGVSGSVKFTWSFGWGASLGGCGSWPRGFVLAARVASRAGQITILLGAGFRVGLDLGARLSQFGFAFLTTLHLGGDR